MEKESKLQLSKLLKNGDDQRKAQEGIKVSGGKQLAAWFASKFCCGSGKPACQCD